MTQVLIVEDDPRVRADLVFLLRGEGFETEAVGSAEEALLYLRDASYQPQLLLLDVRLPGMSGVELATQLAADGGLPPAVALSGEASVADAVQALKTGVHDFVEKPFRRERLLQAIHNALEHHDLRRQVAQLESELGGAQPILGNSAAIHELREQIDRAAATDARVLIVGESGAGKELVADALHAGSQRRDQPYVKINCAAIPATLIEDELFGHVRGAFTDARGEKAGLFEEADGGTLLLDEIGDMEPQLQARLLRVLEDGRVRRLGGANEVVVDVRVLAATNTDLQLAVAEKRFREDLYYRLAAVPIEVPPLRARPQDVPLLFEHFLELFCRRNKMRLRSVEPSVYEVLHRYRWPGNVRELRSLAQRLAVFGADPITVEQIPPLFHEQPEEEGVGFGDERGGEETLPLREFRRRNDRRYISEILRRCGGNVSEAARVLGIHRSRLHQKLTELEIERP